MTIFESRIFDEPELEFGDRHHHPDPRLGLFEAGPLQTFPGDLIKVGVVGSAKTISDTRTFLARATAGVEGGSKRLPNLHPDFPGLGNQSPFRCRFEIDDGATATLSQSRLDRIVREPDDAKAVTAAVEAIVAELRGLDEGGHRPHVALVVLPVALVGRVWADKVEGRQKDDAQDENEETKPDFRGLLKARAMDLSFPIQIVWEDVVDENAKIPRKVKEATNRSIQDVAGRSWNLLTTLYYKGSGRIPWRRMPKEGEFTACYVGISFYREIGGPDLYSSAAQMFDERGRGFILKGRRAQTESRGRHPYMTTEDAREMIENVLAAYRTHHKTQPARVIVLKTSRFRQEEAEGISQALDDADTELRDLVWVQETSGIRLLRDGNYPVLRGTLVELDGKGLLYTTGSMPYYGTYPGQYDPRPLLLCPHESCESTITQIAEEVFSLTKLNWNSTHMNQRLPIPIRAARAVGEVLKHMRPGQVESTDYRKYI